MPSPPNLPLINPVSGLGQILGIHLARPLERHTQKVSQLVNSLLMGGYITMTGQGTFVSGFPSGSPNTVPGGGTGLSTLTAHAVLIGAGTSAIHFATAGAFGRLLIDQGAAADPAFVAMSGDATITQTGAITVAAINGVVVSGAASANKALISSGSTTASWTTVPNAALANSTITVTAGSGLSGGGTASLGNTITLSLLNSSLTVTAGTGLTGGGSVALGGSTTISIANTITAAGPIGAAATVPVITYNAQGQLTTVTTATITPAAIGAPSGSGNSTGTNTGDQTITLTGNVTGSGSGSFSTTIAAGVVTNSMLAGSIDLTSKVTNALPVANGGTGDATLAAYAVLCGGTTATGAVQPVASVGSSGQVLTSNGASALPTFQAASSSLPADPNLCTGRISLSSTSAITTTDLTAQGTVYFTAGLQGNGYTTYSGSWKRYSLTSSLSLPLASSGISCTYSSGSKNVTLTAGSTALLMRGMLMSGTDFPAGTIATITSSTTLTMNVNAMANATAQARTFSVLSGSMLDIFLVDNSGTPQIQGFIWSSSSSRGATLTLGTQDGVQVNSIILGVTAGVNDSNAIPIGFGRYLGSLYCNNMGTTEDSVRNRLVWSFYNQTMKKCEMQDTTSNNTASATYIQVNSIQISYVSGLGNQFINVTATGNLSASGAAGNGMMTIGSSTTTQATGAVPAHFYTATSLASEATGVSVLSEAPAAGLVTRYMLYNSSGGIGTAFYVDSSATIPSVLRADVLC